MTTRLTAIGAGFLAVSAVLSSADSASAQQPDLTTRVMIAWNVDKPLDWDQEGSLALVVLPKRPDSTMAVREIAIPDTQVITDTLAKGFPDVAEEEISWLAQQLLAAFEPQGEDNILRTSFVTAPVAHVTTGGTEFLDGKTDYVCWDRSPPPSGATAQAGRQGDVLVLGQFFVKQNLDGSHALPASTWVLVDDSEAAPAVQIADGLLIE